VPAQPLLDLGCVSLDPSVDGRVIDRHAAFGHHLLEIAIADAVAAVPAHRPKHDLAPNLQHAVHEMCVQPDRKGQYLKIEGDFNGGALLKITGVNGAGKITKEQWDGISQTLKSSVDPRACAITLVGMLIPALTTARDCTGRPIIGFGRQLDVVKQSPEMGGGHSKQEWCINAINTLRGEQPNAEFSVIGMSETSQNHCYPFNFNCPQYTYTCNIRIKADPICN
jgi:hypothetical protein